MSDDHGAPATPNAAQRLRSSRASKALLAWFDAKGWKPFAFQREVWRAVQAGESGLLHATTGSGKTYAVWLGALLAFSRGPKATRDRRVATDGSNGGGEPSRLKPLLQGSSPESRSPCRSGFSRETPGPQPLTVVWLTPMRALAADTARALQAPLDALRAAGAADWTLGVRTGDTGSGERSAQSRRLPSVLVTTPESLSVLLARADARDTLGGVRLVVVDEWHELIGNKRGVQVQLALARLKTWNESLCVWGVSATLGNLREAMDTLLGPGPSEGRLVQGAQDKALVIDTLLPTQTQRFPWAGHLGLSMLPQVVREIGGSSACLVFTNTRSQAELWFQALLEARPDWAGLVALHHGSLDREVREWVETAMKAGQLKAVVCTSSLDLGVDFLPVERVLQIGSPKGVARLLQRAGRSGHAPGRSSRITLVPTHSLEVVEAAAVRAAVQAGQIESRRSPPQPLDVLAQHLVTVALGGGFEPGALYREVTRTAAYRGLSPQAWQWCLDFVRHGGSALAAYPDYQRVAPDADGVWRVPDARLARRHRLNIGTISSNASITVQFWSAGGTAGGARLGSIEENFIARLKPGECFLFGGRLLELVRVHQMTAFVRRASGKRASVPRWNGGRMPLSTTLADAMVEQLAAAAEGRFDSPEMRWSQPMLALQQRWSHLPTPRTLLAEVLKSREGWHLFLYPFAGRSVHMGLSSLLAWRAAREQPGTFSIAINDYGLELLSAVPIDWPARLPGLLAPAGWGEGAMGALLGEVLASLNAGELARRRFRDIARIAGLVFNGNPSERKSSRQLQASSQLFYEVFRKYDPDNQLLRQAEKELLTDELEVARLAAALARMDGQRLVVQALRRPTPLAWPLMVERMREQLSNESLADRIARMVQQLEAAAGVEPAPSNATDAAHGAAWGPPAENQAREAVMQSLVFAEDTLSGRSDGKKSGRAPSGRRRRGKTFRPLPLL
jgi:ATP-dependent Lhr-like helicase